VKKRLNNLFFKKNDRLGSNKRQMWLKGMNFALLISAAEWFSGMKRS
jgi:hypothetical protein